MTSAQSKTPTAINAAALTQLREVLDATLPNVRDHGSVFMSRDRRGTVTVNKRHGSWTDNRGGNIEGRDIASLYAHLNKCSLAEAMQALASVLGATAEPAELHAKRRAHESEIEPFPAACPAIIPVPILVPIMIETPTPFDPALVEAMSRAMDAIESAVNALSGSPHKITDDDLLAELRARASQMSDDAKAELADIALSTSI